VTERLSVVLLPLGELVGGERVVPAQIVPIIDVFFEGDNLRTGNGLFGFEPDQQSVRGWAAGAAFRGEEFDDYRNRC
jgi:hypothetical protein